MRFRRFFRRSGIVGAALLLAAIAVTPTFAQESVPNSVVSGEEVKAAALAQLKLMSKNLLQIANGLPADKYTWNPGQMLVPPPTENPQPDDYGRPVANIVLHIANLNFTRPVQMGAAPPEGFNPKGYENSTTDKAKVIEQVSKSFDYAQSALQKMTAEDLGKVYKVGNRETTGNAIVFTWLSNLNDYMGQFKTYGRINGVIGTDPGGFRPRSVAGKSGQ